MNFELVTQLVTLCRAVGTEMQGDFTTDGLDSSFFGINCPAACACYLAMMLLLLSYKCKYYYSTP